MEENQLYTIILRHDTSTNWTIQDPVLAFGEYGVEDDTHRVKRGDGTTKWSLLTYETFGIEYSVTFKSISGNVYENEQLATELNNKVSINNLNSVVTSINLVSDETVLARIDKVDKNLETNEIQTSNLVIMSNDNSISGRWVVSDDGIKMLNLSTSASNLAYDNTDTELQSETIQDAITELAEGLKWIDYDEQG